MVQESEELDQRNTVDGGSCSLRLTYLKQCKQETEALNTPLPLPQPTPKSLSSYYLGGGGVCNSAKGSVLGAGSREETVQAAARQRLFQVLPQEARPDLGSHFLAPTSCPGAP